MLIMFILNRSGSFTIPWILSGPHLTCEGLSGMGMLGGEMGWMEFYGTKGMDCILTRTDSLALTVDIGENAGQHLDIIQNAKGCKGDWISNNGHGT